MVYWKFCRMVEVLVFEGFRFVYIYVKNLIFIIVCLFFQDNEINNRKVNVYIGGGIFELCEWKKVRVGDVVKVEKDNFFLVDFFMFFLSFLDGVCYVEIMNLDGEINFKLKKFLE